MKENSPQRVSIVIPVYSGEHTLPTLIEELEHLCRPQDTPAGNRFIVTEVIAVHDCGRDRSDTTLEALAEQYSFIQPIWLTRNFGQHAATMAGMASATGDWVVTLDEDGQQNPRDIGVMLDHAVATSSQLVYARPTNAPPHGFLRNIASATAKRVSRYALGNRTLGRFNSFRLIDGEIARTLASYCGHGVYLDVGLLWIAGKIEHCPVRLRKEQGRPSGYSYLRLLAHFWSLVMTSGTRPLRLITLIGCLSILSAFAITVFAIYAKVNNQVPVQGWASLLIIVAFFSGAILTALGIIAEYLALTMGIAMGKPLYVVRSKPTRPASATEQRRKAA